MWCLNCYHEVHQCSCMQQNRVQNLQEIYEEGLGLLAKHVVSSRKKTDSRQIHQTQGLKTA
jgi:hypothetical protein